jgi:hypothetical protein
MYSNLGQYEKEEVALKMAVTPAKGLPFKPLHSVLRAYTPYHTFLVVLSYFVRPIPSALVRTSAAKSMMSIVT